MEMKPLKSPITEKNLRISISFSLPADLVQRLRKYFDITFEDPQQNGDRTKRRKPEKRAKEKEEKRLNVHDISERYGVSKWTVYRWVRTKRLPHIKVSNRVIRFLLSDIEQYDKLHTSGRL